LSGIHNVIYKATSQEFQEYQGVLQKYEEQWKSDLSARRKPTSYILRTPELLLT
jgi:hypothetical protein